MFQNTAINSKYYFNIFVVIFIISIFFSNCKTYEIDKFNLFSPSKNEIVIPINIKATAKQKVFDAKQKLQFLKLMKNMKLFIKQIRKQIHNYCLNPSLSQKQTIIKTCNQKSTTFSKILLQIAPMGKKQSYAYQFYEKLIRIIKYAIPSTFELYCKQESTAELTFNIIEKNFLLLKKYFQ